MNLNKYLNFQDFIQINQKPILILIILTSLIIKLLVFNFLSVPQFHDVETYINTINLFLNNLPVSDQIMPVYPIIVYLVQSFFNISLFNIILSCLTAILIFELTKYILDKIIFRFIVLIIISFYPYNIFYSITGFSEIAYIFTLTLMILFFYKNKIFYAVVVGTIGILIKPIHFYPLFILVFFFDYFYFKKNFKKSVIDMTLSIFIFIFLMSPWWIYNFKQYNKFIMFNLAGPHTLFIGNNPLNKTGGGVVIDQIDIKNNPDRFSQINIDFSYDLLIGYPGFEYNNELKKNVFSQGKEAALARYNSYLEYSFEFIKNNPIKFLELSYKKFIRFWRLWPFTHEFNKIHYIIISILSFGPILILFSCYCFKFLKFFEKKTFPLLLMIFYFNFVHIILISSIRYRFPVENFIIILAIYFGFNTYQYYLNNKN